MWVAWVKTNVILDMASGISFSNHFLKFSENNSITQQSQNLEQQCCIITWKILVIVNFGDIAEV